MLVAVGLTRVLVAASHRLVADTVGAALVSEGFETRGLWLRSSQDDTPGARPVAPRFEGARGFDADVGVFLSDLTTAEQLRQARAVVATADVPWLVLTGATPGPTWGALLECGVSAVLPSDSVLADVDTALHRLAAGERLMSARQCAYWIETWRNALGRREDLLRRMRSLTPREENVLVLLYGGHPVRDIAALLGVTEATVRSHVKATLRKLDASSQIDAVALVSWLRENPQLSVPA